MSKINTVKADFTPEEIDDLLNGCELADDDYILVIGQDGELKNVFLPDVSINDIPDSVQKTLAQFGVSDLQFVTGNQTLH